MRMLTDETVGKSTVAALRHLGHDVLDIRDAAMAGSDDTVVASRAKSERRVVVTHDKHFGDLLRFGRVGHHGAIVVRLRNPTPESTNRTLTWYFSSAPEDHAVGKVVILTERGFRSRGIGHPEESDDIGA